MAGRPALVAVNSGTSALHLGLLPAGIGPGDEVIIPVLLSAASTNCILLTGATPCSPMWRPPTATSTPDLIAAAMTPRTKASCPCTLRPRATWASRASPSEHGLSHRGCGSGQRRHLPRRLLGRFGASPLLRLYATKNIAAGEGGVVTSLRTVAHRSRCCATTAAGSTKRDARLQRPDLRPARAVAPDSSAGSSTTLGSLAPPAENATWLNEHITRLETPRRPLPAGDSTPGTSTPSACSMPARARARRTAAYVEAPGVGTGSSIRSPSTTSPTVPPSLGDVALPVAERARPHRASRCRCTRR